ncbi:hypothetical protein B0H17DRAFT_1142016 [Mycena rosella]|uniref:Uncharacterized protein n=1 Tax=Mycena rosella TaxID=1033263 RepID=A0AAD7CYQ3_MYCRO|nr:hypothetical protein B0H17DRAFT_1142016 [Mycena rosella]
MSFTFVPTEMPAFSLHSSDATTYKENLKNASRSKNASLKQRTIASEIPLDQLRVSSLQLKQLKEIHQRHATTIDDGISPVDYLYGVGDDNQLAAITIMVHQGLDIDARERLDNRWSLQWSRSSGKSAKTAGSTKRILFLWLPKYLPPTCAPVTEDNGSPHAQASSCRELAGRNVTFPIG